MLGLEIRWSTLFWINWIKIVQNIVLKTNECLTCKCFKSKSKINSNFLALIENRKFHISGDHFACQSFYSCFQVSSQEQQFTAIKGECPSNDESCYNSFYLFTGITAIVAFFASSGRVGSILIHLRAIEVRDKVSR